MTARHTRLSCTIGLPRNFRRQDFLAFHQRDAQQIAERVDGTQLQKGLAWHGQPACLSIAFNRQRAEVTLDIQGESPKSDPDRLATLAEHMLGLTQPVETFEQIYRNHTQIGRLIAANAGLRVPQAATPFEALSWAIIGQQISVSAATSTRRKLVLAAAMRHKSGLHCYPDAAVLATLNETHMRQAGLSQSKTKTLKILSEQVQQGLLSLTPTRAATNLEALRTQLLAIPGIGPWTINYALLRGFAWLDGSLEGDVAVRRNLQILLELPEKPTEKIAREWLKEFAPWRALVAAHLWGM